MEQMYIRSCIVIHASATTPNDTCKMMHRFMKPVTPETPCCYMCMCYIGFDNKLGQRTTISTHIIHRHLMWLPWFNLGQHSGVVRPKRSPTALG